jgi:hypothetical protein
MFLDKKTKGFKFNLSLIFWILLFIWCVSVISTLKHARAENIKVPKNCHIHAHIAARRLSELGSLPHFNQPKQSRKPILLPGKQ